MLILGGRLYSGTSHTTFLPHLVIKILQMKKKYNLRALILIANAFTEPRDSLDGFAKDIKKSVLNF